MSWIPGWESVAGASLWSNIFFWAGIIALLFLGISEVVSHRYGERKDELVSEQQSTIERRHDEEMARLHLQAANLEKEAAEANERAKALEVRAKELERELAAAKALAITAGHHGSLGDPLGPPLR